MTNKDRILLDHAPEHHYIRDPVDGGRILSSESRAMLFDWCEENCQGKYWIGMGFGQFELAADAVLFRLTWG